MQSVMIHHRQCEIETDPGYGRHIGTRFEPHTVNLLQAMCDPDSVILDIGANIGMTAIAMAQMAVDGRVLAFEPVQETYGMLERNVRRSELANIETYRIGLGAEDKEVLIQGAKDNLSGAFVAGHHVINDKRHFSEMIHLKRLDRVVEDFGITRVDVVKIDVEGHELDVLAGATETLLRFKPRVLLEMNYAALNMWRSTSVPEFVAHLLNVFPQVFAVQEQTWRDLRDPKEAHEAMFAHLTEWKYMDIVAGYDRNDVVSRLEQLLPIFRANQKAFSEAFPPLPPVFVNDRTGPKA